MRRLTKNIVAAAAVSASLLLSQTSYAAYNGSTFTSPPSVSLQAPYPTLNYVTPAMYGAKCDGSTNDTSAMTSAVSGAVSAGAILYISGGGTCIVDTLPLVSNVTIEGDGVTTIKLKNNASGPMFSITSSLANVRVAWVNLDGNLSGQNTPHDLTNSIFYATGGGTLTNSKFDHLSIKNAAGEVFGYQIPLTNVSLTNLTISGHYQTSIDTIATNSLFQNITVTNPGTIRQAAYGLAFGAGGGNIVDNVNITLGTSNSVQQTAIVSSDNYDTFSNIVIDAANGAQNYGVSLNPGTGNRLSNIADKNDAYFFDFELIGQVQLTVNNTVSVNSHSGFLLKGACADDAISNVTFSGIAGSELLGTLTSAGQFPTRVKLTNYTMNGGASGLVLQSVNSFGAYNGAINNITGTAIDTGNSQAKAGVIIDGLTIDTANVPIALQAISGGTVANLTATNLTTPTITMSGGNSNIHFKSLNGVSFAIVGGRSLNGFFEGKLEGFYSNGVHGGAVGTIDLGDTLPLNAVVTNFVYRVRSTLTSGTSMATVALGTIANNAAFKAATVVSDSSWNGSAFHNGIEDGTAANYYWNNSAPSDIAATIAVEALTGGLVEWKIEFYITP